MLPLAGWYPADGEFEYLSMRRLFRSRNEQPPEVVDAPVVEAEVLHAPNPDGGHRPTTVPFDAVLGHQLGPTPEPTETDFWDHYDRVAASAELFVVPSSAISLVVGPLECSVPVIRQAYDRHWGNACDVYVLSDRQYVPGHPDWNMVASPSDLVSVLKDGLGNFPLLVLDVPAELPPFVRPLVQRLRNAGLGMVRYVVDGDPSDEDLATWSGELGRPTVLDLATPLPTSRVLDLLDRGEPVVSIAGMEVSTELLLAMRFDQESDR